MTAAEQEAMLYRAFVERRARYVVISSRREIAQIEAVNYGISHGWLESTWHDADEQSTYLTFRLTDKGSRHFGVPRRG